MYFPSLFVQNPQKIPKSETLCYILLSIFYLCITVISSITRYHILLACSVKPNTDSYKKYEYLSIRFFAHNRSILFLLDYCITTTLMGRLLFLFIKNEIIFIMVTYLHIYTLHLLTCVK